jgi:hypothetical protein
VLAEVEIRREDGRTKPWWNITHIPTGKIVALPMAIEHPYLGQASVRVSRWKTRKEAQAAIEQARKLFDCAARPSDRSESDE